MYFLKSKEFGNFVKSLHNCKELCKFNYINLHSGSRMSGGGDTDLQGLLGELIFLDNMSLTCTEWVQVRQKGWGEGLEMSQLTFEPTGYHVLNFKRGILVPGIKGMRIKIYSGMTQCQVLC